MDKNKRKRKTLNNDEIYGYMLFTLKDYSKETEISMAFI